MMKRAFTTMLVAALGMVSMAAKKPAAKKVTHHGEASARSRGGLGLAFGNAVCPGGSPDRRAAAWTANVFDAQVEGRYLEKIGARPVRQVDAERKAKTLAQTRRYGSYAAGVCANGDGWAIAFPAPVGLAPIDLAGRLHLPGDALASRCEGFRADYAKSEGGAPVPLAIRNNIVDIGKLAAGTVSITCQPKTPRWQGPILWYLRPVGKGPADAIPEADALAQASEPAAALTTWINRVRRKEGLAAVEIAAAASEQAALLAVDGSLTHDRQGLRKAEALLKTQDIRFLGEDRVRGIAAQDMAWLLWNSPRHRGLILNKDATTLGVGVRGLGTESLAVIIIGAKAPMTTAAGTPAKKGG